MGIKSDKEQVMSRTLNLLKDDVYQLIEIRQEPYERIVICQGTLQEIEAYLALEERGLL